MQATPPAPTPPAITAAASDYPVNIEFDYQESLSRLTTFFRLILAIPILFISYFLSNFLVVGTWFMLVFRKKYPTWWFDFQAQYLAFMLRLEAYLLLMTDRYPSTDEAQNVTLEIERPAELSRWLPFVKWLLALPHFIVLYLLFVGAVIAVVIAWFAILITGRYPRGLFNFVAGVLRWVTRVTAYAIYLMTDRYPPFRLSP